MANPTGVQSPLPMGVYNVYIQHLEVTENGASLVFKVSGKGVAFKIEAPGLVRLDPKVEDAIDRVAAYLSAALPEWEYPPAVLMDFCGWMESGLSGKAIWLDYLDDADIDRPKVISEFDRWIELGRPASRLGIR